VRHDTFLFARRARAKRWHRPTNTEKKKIPATLTLEPIFVRHKKPPSNNLEVALRRAMKTGLEHGLAAASPLSLEGYSPEPEFKNLGLKTRIPNSDTLAGGHSGLKQMGLLFHRSGTAPEFHRLSPEEHQHDQIWMFLPHHDDTAPRDIYVRL
jgi:hypothetical protein